jgi:hypothetical protein
MSKKFLLSLILIISAIVLGACGGAASYDYAEAPAAPMESKAYGGGFDDGMVAEFEMAEEESGSANFSDSTSSETIERMVIKNADLSIVVTEPLGKMDVIAAMAEEMGGFVVGSNVWQTTLNNGSKVPHASITIRVPAERFDVALDTIKAGVGEVTGENISGQDVTSEYTDLRSRLRNLEAAETKLQEIMDEATDTDDVLQVYNNLIEVREQIEVIKGQMQYYEQAAALSMISVDISGDAEAQPIQIGGWKPGGVAKDAIETMVDTLQWLGDAAIWVGLCVLPIGIIIGIPLFFVIRAARRMRQRRKVEKSEPLATDSTVIQK